LSILCRTGWGQGPNHDQRAGGNRINPSTHHGPQLPSHPVPNNGISNRTRHRKPNSRWQIGVCAGEGVNDEGCAGAAASASHDRDEIT
jgi:hypothetical protein